MNRVVEKAFVVNVYPIILSEMNCQHVVFQMMSKELMIDHLKDLY
jgi:hypothetical protein